MRRVLLLLGLLLACGYKAHGQTSIATGPVDPTFCTPGAYFYNTTSLVYKECGPANVWTVAGVPSGTVNPATCNPGDLFSNTSTNPPVLYICGTGNVWTAVGGATPAGNNGDVQIKSGSSLAAGCINSPASGRTAMNCDTSFAGPNPWTDATQTAVGQTGGFRLIDKTSAPAIAGCNATISGGTNTATLSGSGCTSLRNGDGVIIYGLAGQAGPGITAPVSSIGTINVTPTVPLSMSGVNLNVASQTGSTTYNYTVCYTNYGTNTATNPGTSYTCAAASTSVGLATLGHITVSITSISVVKNTFTYVTGSAQNMAVGAAFEVTGASPTLFNGTYKVLTWTDTTHFTAAQVGDVREDFPTSATTPGNLTVIYGNEISVPTAPAGSVNNSWFVVYNSAPSGGGNPICVSWPQSTKLTTNPEYNRCSDYGADSATMKLPPGLPTTAPAAGTVNEGLNTTITAGGGTTSITLADNAANNCTSCSILFDDAVTFEAITNTAFSNNSRVYVPTGFTANNVYVFNAPATIATKVEIDYSGGFFLNYPITVGSLVNFNGLWMPNGSAYSFEFNMLAQIQLSGTPFGFIRNAQMRFANVSINQLNPNQVGIITVGTAGDFANTRWDNVQFSLSGVQSLGFVSTGAEFGFEINNALIGGGQIGLANMKTPGIYFNGGSFKSNNLMFSGKGMLYRPGSAGGNLVLNWTYSQGNYTPFFGIINSTGGATGCVVDAHTAVTDTTFAPVFTNYGGILLSGSLANTVAVQNIFSGSGPTDTVNSSISTSFALTGTSIGAGHPYPEGTDIGVTSGTVLDTNWQQSTNAFAVVKAVKQVQASILAGPGDGLGIRGLTPAACTATVSSGGSVPVGSPVYTYILSYADGTTGPTSNSCTATTSSGNQTVTLTVPPPYSYGVNCVWWYRSSGGGGVLTAACKPTTFVDTAASTVGNSSPSITASGPASCEVVQTTTLRTGLATCHTQRLNVANIDETQNLVAADSFNRANNPITTGQANWVIPSGGYNITANVVAGTSASHNFAVWSGEFISDDQVSTLVRTAGSNGFAMVRANSATDQAYICGPNNGTNVTEYFFNAGSFNQIATVAYTVQVNDIFIAKAVGSTITCQVYSAGAQVVNLSGTHTTLTSGYPGVMSQNTTFTFDNFAAWPATHPIMQADQENYVTQPLHILAGGALTMGIPQPTAGTLTQGVYLDATSPLNMAEGANPGANIAGWSIIDANSTTHELAAATNGSTSFGMLTRAMPGAINQTGQTAAITTATLCAASAGACNVTGQYHVHFDVWGSGTACGTPAPGGVTPSLTWTDENATNHAAVVIPMAAQTTATALTVNVTAPTVPFQTALANEGGSGDFIISTNGTVIQYAVAYAACGVGTGTYNIRGTVTRLQ